MEKTIAQQLNVKTFPFEIKDDKGNKIYYETSDGFWIKSKYDDKGKTIYYEYSDGFWRKYEYDDKGNEIYSEDSKGVVIDNRLKPSIELTLDEIAAKFGISVDKLQIKKQ